MAAARRHSFWRSSSVIAEQSSQPPVFDISTQDLHDRIQAIRNATSTLLQDTRWPPHTTLAAQGLLQTIKSLPDVAPGVIPAGDAARQYIRVLEAVHATVQKVSENYGIKERGFRNKIKSQILSLRPNKCTDSLRTCREEIDKALMMLGNRLDTNTNDSAPPGRLIGWTEPSIPPDQHPLSLAEPGGDLIFPESPTSISANADKRPVSPKRPRHPGSVPDPSRNLPEDQESRRPIRGGVILACRKTFKAMGTMSGAIPGVGGFLGVVAKVGLAFVNITESMDENNDLCKELTSHTSELSQQLEPFTKISTEHKGDEWITQINNLQRELRHVQGKVEKWRSSGRFQKAFISSDNAEALKDHTDMVQSVLEEIKMLVSLNLVGLVAELRHTELRTERRRLLGRLGDGSNGMRGSSIEATLCLPGTRVEILTRINDWIRDTSATAEPVLWIRGMAGRGKSTIASTVAHYWSSKGSCAIFHFRQDQNALNEKFICALARQLGQGLVPEVKNSILECVKENEDIAKERLEQQFKVLFVGSLGKLHGNVYPIVIIIDALEGCTNTGDAERFVRLIDQHSPFLPSNVKFLLTCRPEASLLTALESTRWHAEDLDSIPHTSEDIAFFIDHAFAQVRDEHDLPKSWPSLTDLEGLVEISQGLFQWARTAVAYIGEGSPRDRLEVLLRGRSRWRELDNLYHLILSRAFEKVGRNSTGAQLLSWVLGTLVVAPYPVSLEVIAFLYADQGIFQGQDNTIDFLRQDTLAELTSLLHIPTSPFEPVRLMHTSIRDLLSSRKRCGNQPYFVDLIQHHRRLASLTLRIMARDLRTNICNLSDVSKEYSEIQDEVQKHVSEGLRYCCRSWFAHLTAGLPRPDAKIKEESTSGILESFQLVSGQNLLSWLEVMSLMGATTDAHTTAKEVHHWIQQRSSDESLIALWNDVQRFTATFFEPISFSPLHIYASALPHCPEGTTLSAKYRNQARTRILLGERKQNWPANIWTALTDSPVITLNFSPDGALLASGLGGGMIRFWDTHTGLPLGDPLTGHYDSITSVAFSPSGKVLASGSDDKTIRLWDAQTGAPLGEPLKRHSNSITSVVFSPDGKVLASGSNDQTVIIWDAQTGAPLGDPLTGHISPIKSVAFSPDGKVLASGSDDRTVRLWDAWTGAPLGEPLTNDNGSITSVAFSPDGKALASGSDDRTVRLWDPQTGVAFGDPLTGHRLSITSVVFSPDSKTLVSGSYDGTIRWWDPQTATTLGEPLTGHKNRIRSVAFSPDGRALASGSDDRTIRLWDVKTRTLLSQPQTSHSEWVRSFGFSPDGKLLASGSNETAVRLWNAQTGESLGDTLTGHNKAITAVIFSPDNKVLASGSDDMTVRLWDAQTGAPLGEPLAGHGRSITSVAFSPDGTVLASGSDDNTVRLWDTQTGAALGQPLSGHRRAIRVIAFSPDGKMLASGSDDRTVILWDRQTGGQSGKPLTSHRDSISSVIFSPDGKLLASGSDNRMVLWDVQTGAPIGAPLPGHSSPIKSVIFSTDGKVLATGLANGTVKLWDSSTLKPFDGLPGNFTSRCVGIQSNWVVCDSRRVVWLPPHYRSESPSIEISPLGIIARVSDGVLSILDVSQVLRP